MSWGPTKDFRTGEGHSGDSWVVVFVSGYRGLGYSGVCHFPTSPNSTLKTDGFTLCKSVVPPPNKNRTVNTPSLVMWTLQCLGASLH